MANVKTQDRPSLSIVRKFDTAPAKVWRALTEPEMLKQWMVPEPGMRLPVAEVDLRVGGRYRMIFNPPGGEMKEVGGIYREIVPGRKLVYTWVFKGTPERESLVTIELRASGGGTELSLRHEQFADEEARDKHQYGWSGCLASLEKLLT